MAAKHTEILTVVASAWTQIDSTPLSSRKYAEVLNQSSDSIGVIFGGTNPGTGVAWSSGEQILPGDKGSLAPADSTVPTWVRSATLTLSTAGSAPILREWA